MRRFVPAALLGCLLSLPGFSALAGGNPSTSDIRQNLFDSCFSSPTEGWAVGDLGRVFHTSDGGRSWSETRAGSGVTFVAVACQGQRVWVAGQGGKISASSDGGRTWKLQATPVTHQLLDISFPDTRHGLAVGFAGTVLRTADGGETWSKVELPADIPLPEEFVDVYDPRDMLAYGVEFLDPQHAWLVGEFGIILRSSDGGVTWQSQTSGVSATLFGVGFADRQRGWAVGVDATMLATFDGGETWSRQNVATPKGFRLSLFDVAVKAQSGWAVGDSGYLLHTVDGGASWKLADVPVRMAGNWFRGISLLSGDHGFLVGAKGLVLETKRDTFTPMKTNF